MKEITLLHRTPLRDLSEIQKKVIHKLSSFQEDVFEDFYKTQKYSSIQTLFGWNETKEKWEYWNNITVEQFEKDILEEKFNYLPEINVNNLSTNLNKIITKLNNYVNIKTN